MPVGTVSQVRVTEVVLGFKCPFKLSLVSTLLVVPPLAPLVIVKVSVLAIIAGAPTTIVAVALLQAVVAETVVHI